VDGGPVGGGLLLVALAGVVGVGGICEGGIGKASRRRGTAGRFGGLGGIVVVAVVGANII